MDSPAVVGKGVGSKVAFVDEEVVVLGTAVGMLVVVIAVVDGDGDEAVGALVGSGVGVVDGGAFVGVVDGNGVLLLKLCCPNVPITRNRERLRPASRIRAAMAMQLANTISRNAWQQATPSLTATAAVQPACAV